MKHIGLFEGIGGFSLAARWMNWETVAWCEWNEFCQKVLSYHFPKAEKHGDITKTDFTIYRGQCDIVTGGFPCQPYSVAGKRKGKEDDRHLWPEMLRAIGEIQPSWVVGENVPGLLNWQRGMVLDEIKADLEAAGFEVFPSLVLPACGKNAPHRRDRLWIVAYSRHNSERKATHSGTNEGSEFATIHTEGQGGESKTVFNNGLCDLHRDVADPDIPRLSLTRFESEQQTSNAKQRIKYRSSKIIADTNNQGLQGSKVNGSIGEIVEVGNEQFAGCVSPDWENFPTQSPVCGRNDGIPNRVDRIKALGNAIVPQVAYEIFKAIALMEVEMMNRKTINAV